MTHRIGTIIAVVLCLVLLLALTGGPYQLGQLVAAIFAGLIDAAKGFADGIN